MSSAATDSPGTVASVRVRAVASPFAADTVGVRQALLPAVLAAVAAMAAHLTGMWLTGVFPFGDRPWAVNDAHHQLLPQKAYLRDLLLHPGGPDSLLFNWHSALGLPYLGDFATYAASPGNLLLVLFPEDQLTLAAQTIALLQIGSAAAAMTWLLLSLHRSAPRVIAVALGAAYAGSGWLTGDGIVVLSWLDGLVAFPVLLWAAVQLVRRRHFAWSVLLVALFWTANYYTAVMATLGTGLVLLALLAVDRAGLRESALALTRVILGFALGIAMVAWLVLPVLDEVRSAARVPATHLYQVTWWEALAQLFPGKVYSGSPGLFIGLGTLVLVAAAPWNRRLAARVRIILVVLPVAAVVSVQLPATQLLWHSFAAPNGSDYREAFVIAGILAISAWLGLGAGLPERWPALGGVAVVAALAALVAGQRLLPVATLALTAVSLVLLAATAAGRPRWLPVLMIVTILGESGFTAAALYRENAKIHGGPNTVSAGALDVRHGLVPIVPRGERARVPSHGSDNDPLLLGYDGVDYYSSTLPQTTADALSALGLRYYRRRVALADDDPAAGALLGVHSRTGDRVNAPVTVLPAVTAADGVPPGTVWATRDRLAGLPLYSAPALRLTERATGRVTQDGPLVTHGPAEVDVAADCRPGSILQVVTPAYAPERRGSITWQGRTSSWDVPQVHTLGPVPADGHVAFTLRGDGLRVRPGDVGCLDPQALDRMVTTSRGQGADVHFGQEQVSIAWPAPQTGDAVILTTALPGWACRTDDGPVAVTARAGMLTVPVRDASRLTCSYHPRGLLPGLVITAVAVALTVVVQVLRIRRGHRVPPAGASPTGS
ncbi:YfhO family protein [Raineyella fluvialis]|uniref:YfhO family protein n=1 Tax=Raineyella fluvialis TaxID=2662261 RepID=A0A5Q2F9K6_9ACTN|nr:YfhO family protein [Raineyella fluvialis]QGF23582.1 YfhO family protein [Raineyella fluvialis]